MFKKIITIIALAIGLMTAQESRAEEMTADNLMGFEAKSDLRVGPVISGLYPISVNSSSITYNPIVNVNLHGESFNFGSTGFNFTWISSTRSFSTAPLTQDSKLTFNEVSPGNNVSKVNKNLLLLTLSSPINYTEGQPLEFGWLGGIFSQFVSTDNNISGDSNSNLGLNLGGYSKVYQFYPFVPYVNGKILFGNMYDNGKTRQTNTLSNSLKGGYMGSVGMDLYITRRIIFNIGYNIMNPDFYTLSPTKALANDTSSPKDDNSFSFDEQMHGVSASFGFLF